MNALNKIIAVTFLGFVGGGLYGLVRNKMRAARRMRTFSTDAFVAISALAQHGFPSEEIVDAFAGKDFERAASLMASHAMKDFPNEEADSPAGIATKASVQKMLLHVMENNGHLPTRDWLRREVIDCLCLDSNQESIDTIDEVYEELSAPYLNPFTHPFPA